MHSRRAHFEAHAAALADCATLEVFESDGATTMTLRPEVPQAVGVALYLSLGEVGTVTFDDPASSPAELGEVMEEDLRAIDWFVEAAVEGRVTAFGGGSGGAVEVRTVEGVDRTWKGMAFPLPGWKKRSDVREYQPYR